MKTVNIHEAKTQFSKLIAGEVAGQETIISKAGKPVARLVSIATPVPLRKFGVLKGKIKIAADFDAPLPPSVLDAFEGR